MTRLERILCLISASAAMLFVSCQKQQRDITIADQEKSIENFMTDFAEEGNRVENIGGVMKGVIDEGTGAGAIDTDTVFFSYAGYIFSSGPGELFVTNNATIASKYSFPQMEYPLKKCVGDNDLIEGLAKGLLGMKEGEHCYLAFSAKYGYCNTIVYNVPELSPLIFEIWVEKVKAAEE